MRYKCCKCGRNEVSSKYGICEDCASHFIELDDKCPPMIRDYVSSGAKPAGGIKVKNKPAKKSAEPVKQSEPFNLIGEANPNNQVSAQLGQHTDVTRTKKPPAPSPTNEHIDSVSLPQPQDTYTVQPAVQSSRNHVSGYVNNITIQQDSPAFAVRYFRCLFTGVPLSFSEQVISFDMVFDRSGESIDDSGNRSVLVEVYGSSRQNSISQYNHVDVYGRRNHNNVMIANKVVNNDNGVSITTLKISTPVMWVLTVLVILAVVLVFNKIGIGGVIICALVILAITHPRLVFMIFGFIFRMIWGLIQWLFRL